MYCILTKPRYTIFERIKIIFSNEDIEKAPPRDEATEAQLSLKSM